MQAGQSFILMGVSSTGKTTVGLEVARRLQIKLIDGDDLHPRANIVKMGQGQPLNDADRQPWLTRINDAAFSIEQKNEIGIIVCSALKKAYRDQIRADNNKVRFLFLHGDFDLVLSRMQQRKGHFMKTEMLKSQFATLELPDESEPDVTFIDISGSFESVVEACCQAILAS